MQFTQSPTLTAPQLAAVQTLIKKVQAHDHTARDPYLSNRFNVDPAMPAFFVAWEGAQAVGLLTLYADEAPTGVVDVTLNVAPAARRQGIATRLWAAARVVLRAAGYTQVEFMTEAAFLTQSPQFLTRNGLRRDPAGEAQLVTASRPVPPADSALVVKPLQADAIEALLPAYVEAFEDVSLEEARRYLTVNLASTENAPYVGYYHGTLVGYCAVDYGEYDYLFGLFIARAYRGQGLGQRFLRQLIRELGLTRGKPVKLGVELANAVARHVYAQAGFREETQVYYLTAEAGPWRL